MMLADLHETEIPLTEFESMAQNWLTGTRNIVAPKTTTRRLTSVRAFARWTGLGIILAEYKAPTPSKSEPHPIPEGIPGVRRMIDQTANEKQRALVALCGLCGCRVHEAISLRPVDFDLHRMNLKIRGKGDKTRIVPISPEAWEVLQVPVTRAFIEDGRPIVDLSNRFARRIITNLGEKAGLQRSIASHDLRATFATAVYTKTKDIRLVQKLLGHASVDTTQLYVDVIEDKLRAAVVL
jgi:site-specific recombinase XerD